jgi:3-phenylpropionate/cinnamic acid dioxygenase small subunit
MTPTETSTDAALEPDADPTGAQVSASTPLYGEIVDFLYREARLLDRDRHLEWLELLTDDIAYRMPMRKTLYRRDGRGFDGSGNHFNDDRLSLGLRARRNVEIPSAFDRDPAPRIRRMVSNIEVFEGSGADECEVLSSIVVLRSRFDNVTWDMISGVRRDIIRRTSDGLRLAKRTILVDQSLLGAPWISVFM